VAGVQEDARRGPSRSVMAIYSPGTLFLPASIVALVFADFLNSSLNEDWRTESFGSRAGTSSLSRP
jgi:hypothetical protein